MLLLTTPPLSPPSRAATPRSPHRGRQVRSLRSDEKCKTRAVREGRADVRSAVRRTDPTVLLRATALLLVRSVTPSGQIETLASIRMPRSAWWTATAPVHRPNAWQARSQCY